MRVVARASCECEGQAGVDYIMHQNKAMEQALFCSVATLAADVLNVSLPNTSPPAMAHQLCNLHAEIEHKQVCYRGQWHGKYTKD